GFLFNPNSLALSANYGGGFIPLAQGVDYTVAPTLYSGPPDPGNNGNWEAIDIFFAPNRVIATGNVLQIQKSIFEVFGDADPWRPAEASVIAEFPSPEPTGFSFLAPLALAGLARSRR